MTNPKVRHVKGCKVKHLAVCSHIMDQVLQDDGLLDVLNPSFFYISLFSLEVLKGTFLFFLEAK